MAPRKPFSNWAQAGQRKSSHTVSVDGASFLPTGTAGLSLSWVPLGRATLSLPPESSPEEAAQTPTPPATASTATTAPATFSWRPRRSRAFSFSRWACSRSRALLFLS